ncbi:hypothetical protein GCM10010193_32320 [Kitasatospora atroaurantiaca]|uniref:Putative dehydrogenase n=1 Tax=Kitasatospora atroaurantiaca TaxID=285545 RepID=A0A561ERI1_9ACTN|nr:Gfo/Idh/MocA family oxidoreductase [Kitasatospora atroaurantiaca]TWE18217.1 putative dehydrogenase [Kitasatospora atroaurantiaca]
MTRVGVALVGFGAAGRQHLQALARADFADLRGVLEQNPAARTPAGTARYLSWEQLLRDPSVQLVSLCTPPGGRAELARQALAAGKAVLLEKPPAASTAELDLLVELSERSGRPVGVMLQHRFGVPEEVLGRTWQPAATALLEVSRYRPAAYFQRASWRHDPALALGGITAHLGVHYLDLACQLLGEPAEVKLAGARQLVPGIDTRAAGVVRFTGGGTLSFAVTAESVARTERLTILDADQCLLVENGRIALDGGAGPAGHRAASASELRGEVYRDMARAIAAGRQPRRCHLAGARAVTMILESVQQQLVACGRAAPAEPLLHR